MSLQVQDGLEGRLSFPQCYSIQYYNGIIIYLIF